MCSINLINKIFKTDNFNEIYECFKNKKEYSFIPLIF